MTLKSPLRGIQAFRRRHDLAYGGLQTYSQKVLSYGPIAYWPLDEIVGTTARCLVNPLQNGTYARNVATMTTGVGPDGGTAPNFDGANDYVDIYSATFNAAFSGAAGTLHVWAKVSAVGVWTDAAFRTIVSLLADNNNNVWMLKYNTNNTIREFYEANATVKQAIIGGQTSTGWQSFTTTWDKAADEARFYLNGVQQGAAQNLLGVWAGNLSAAQTLIGASTKAPVQVWSGPIGRCSVFNYALNQAKVSDLAAA